MKTPKEKADELYELMSTQTYSSVYYAGGMYHENEVGYEAGKKCAIVAVDEILQLGCTEVPYWQEVKQEIENL